MKMSGFSVSHSMQGFFPVAGAAYDRNVVFDLEQCRQCAENHSLVLRDNHTYGFATVFAGGIQDLPLPLSCLTRGNLIRNLVPAMVSRSTTPPNASIRSRIPPSPLPSA
jgi:hypothetical protein